MKKEWTKTSDFNYTFLVDENEIGKMEIQLNTIASKAICFIGEQVFELKRTGFWKSNLEITDNNGGVVLKTYPEKWYANSWVIDYENKQYKLIVRNNPLAEYAVTENDKDILAYGLSSENKELQVRITTSGKTDFFFDFLLWYLFVPIANENFGDVYSFMIAMNS